jgi:hypothetical protein
MKVEQLLDECQDIQLEIAELAYKQPSDIVKATTMHFLKLCREFLKGANNPEECIKRISQVMEEMKSLKDKLESRLAEA